jgi:hypothetical protein
MIVLAPVITDVLGVLLSSPLTSGGAPEQVVTGFAVTGVVFCADMSGREPDRALTGGPGWGLGGRPEDAGGLRMRHPVGGLGVCGGTLWRTRRLSPMLGQSPTAGAKGHGGESRQAPIV